MLIIKHRHPVHRLAREIFYTLAQPVQKVYWFVFRPYRPGAKTFIFYRGTVLLVRIGYAHKKWVLPGGGIERGETAEVAAIREAYEESGINLIQTKFVGQKNYTNQYKRVTVFYYTAEVTSNDIVIDGQEIIDAAWFPLEALPREISPRLPEEITLYTNWKYGNNH